ncbi:hypothetical protein H6F43_07530 [Leptolyngbya sp. FACHB-36]|uniref:hypothetical protein n=1 Tax=Leptolyngbya sp. FACHB-36 TaxID=2692808 RepID=UPI001681511C|nr:hypothetical protein [Leptolyngbya sp. FACHB-36]MBD2020035.1 hypothetical protein [Leptolyngbya sp. FACHB-36]
MSVHECLQESRKQLYTAFPKQRSLHQVCKLSHLAPSLAVPKWLLANFLLIAGTIGGAVIVRTRSFNAPANRITNDRELKVVQQNLVPENG